MGNQAQRVPLIARQVIALPRKMPSAPQTVGQCFRWLQMLLAALWNAERVWSNGPWRHATSQEVAIFVPPSTATTVDDLQPETVIPVQPGDVCLAHLVRTLAFELVCGRLLHAASLGWLRSFRSVATAEVKYQGHSFDSWTKAADRLALESHSILVALALDPQAELTPASPDESTNWALEAARRIIANNWESERLWPEGHNPANWAKLYEKADREWERLNELDETERERPSSLTVAQAVSEATPPQPAGTVTNVVQNFNHNVVSIYAPQAATQATPPSPAGTAAAQQPAAATAEQIPECAHSIDFRSVTWYGQQLSFTANQAVVVKVLWEQWANRTPDVSQASLQDAAEVDTPMRVLFKDHAGWGRMIHPGATRGTFRLDKPTPADDGKKSCP